MVSEMNILPISSWLDTKYPLLISGPCSLETEEQVMSTAKELAKDERVQIFRGGVWKPRTRPGAFEGIGSVGLKWLAKVKEETGMLIATEVANAQHTREALAAGIDVFWIGARSTASPFTIQEIADELEGHDVIVFVKNPVNPDVQLWIGAFERLSRAGITKLGAIHRGFTPFQKTKFRNYPGWRTVIELKRLMPNLPIICDPSHIAGKRELLKEISQKSFDMGLDGLMVESHINPDVALSDASQQLTPSALGDLITDLRIKREHIDSPELENELELLRDRIDNLDTEIVEILSSRADLVKKIGEYKKASDVTALQIDRWTQMMDDRDALAEKLQVNRELVKSIFQIIHEESVRQQTDIIS